MTSFLITYLVLCLLRSKKLLLIVLETQIISETTELVKSFPNSFPPSLIHAWNDLPSDYEKCTLSLVKLFLIINRLVITLMYCDRLHAWWSTQSRLTTLLSSLIACPWVEPQTIWRFRLKDLSIDERIGAWCRVLGQAHRGLTVGFLLLRYWVVCTVEVSKGAKIRNRYNQVPHLTQDTNGKVTKLIVRHHKREPRGQPFPSRWPQRTYNRRTQRHSKHLTEKKHKRSAKEVPPWNGQ